MKKVTPIGFGAYLKFKPWFLKYYNFEMSQRVTHKHMKHVLVDGQGRSYYEFPESMAMPMVRFLKQKEFMEWMASGLSNETLNDLIKVTKQSLTEAVENRDKPMVFTRKAAQIEVLLNEIADRNEKVIPFDLVINSLCACIVREDEDPHEWNQEIHREKCQFFANHQADYQFFFRLTSFKRLSKYLTDSEEGWSQYLAQSIAQVKIINEKLKAISTDIPSEKAGKTT